MFGIKPKTPTWCVPWVDRHYRTWDTQNHYHVQAPTAAEAMNAVKRSVSSWATFPYTVQGAVPESACEYNGDDDDWKYYL